MLTGKQRRRFSDELQKELAHAFSHYVENKKTPSLAECRLFLQVQKTKETPKKAKVIQDKVRWLILDQLKIEENVSSKLPENLNSMCEGYHLQIEINSSFLFFSRIINAVKIVFQGSQTSSQQAGRTEKEGSGKEEMQHSGSESTTDSLVQAGKKSEPTHNLQIPSEISSLFLWE